VFYRRPNWLTQRMNRAVAWLASAGLAPSEVIALETRGRKTGRPRVVAVTFVDVDGQRYLVSPRGESEWVRNVRAAGGEAVIRRGGRTTVRLEEIGVAERAPILKAYLQKTRRATQALFGLNPDAPSEEFARIAERHPVFRIVEA
jgi:deazaflavin-dependent oxidoreductase (nitroreductase family)